MEHSSNTSSAYEKTSKKKVSYISAFLEAETKTDKNEE